VSTAVINEVLEEAVSRHSPQPLAKDVRENYYGTQVSQPPTIALFVNGNDNYRRYIERSGNNLAYWYFVCLAGKTRE